MNFSLIRQGQTTGQPSPHRPYWPDATASAAYPMDVSPTSYSLKRWLLGIIERRWWFLTIFFAGVAATMLYTFRQTPVYEATSSIQLLREEPSSTEFKQVVDLSVKNTEDFNTQVKLLDSMLMARQVLARLTPAEKQVLMKPYESSSPLLQPKEPLKLIYHNRSIRPARMSLMIFISFRHPDADLAARIANLFSEEFVNYNVRLRSEGAIQAIETLRQRAEEQRRKIEQSELALAQFKEKHKTVAFDQATDIDQQQILLLSSEVTKRQLELDEARTTWKQIEQILMEGGDLGRIQPIRDYPVVLSLRNELAEAVVQFSQIEKRYRARHPRYIEAHTTLQRMQEELRKAEEQAASSIKNQFLKAEELYAQVLAKLSRKQDETVQRQKLQVEYNSMLRTHEINQKMFEYFQGRMEQAISHAADHAPNVRQVDQAMASLEPVSPNVPLNLCIGVMASAGLGLFTAFLVFYLDDRIRTTFDVENRLGLPVLGVITEIKEFDRQDMALLVAEKRHQPTLEQFRTIRSSVEILQPQASNILLITSTNAQEGKSFLASNLANSYAAHQEKTLLVDCDLRRPSVARSYRLTTQAGLLQHLRDKIPLDEAIVRNVYPYLDILPAGGSTDHASEHFSRLSVLQLLQELRARYARVILDTPPLGVVSDALNLLPGTDGVILLIKHQTLPVYRAEKLLRVLQTAHARVLGVVINYAHTKSAGYYDDYYYKREYYPKKEA